MDQNRKPLREPGRFDTLMGRITVYAQNNPRQYGFRVALTIGALCAPPIALLLIALLLTGADASLLLSMTGFLVVALVLAVVLSGLLSTWTMHRMVRGGPLPPDSDPSRVWAAQQQIMRGTLHEDAEVNRLGRMLTEQSDTSRSPTYMTVFACFILVVCGLNVVLQYSSGSPLTPVNLFLMFVAVVLVTVFIPQAMRRQRRVREFRGLYDRAHAGPSGLGGPV